MASRKEQKEQARAERLAKEQELAAKAGRTRRFQIFGGVIVAAVIVIVVAIVVSSSGGSSTAIKPESAAAKVAVKHVDSLLAGIPESGNHPRKFQRPDHDHRVRRPRVLGMRRAGHASQLHQPGSRARHGLEDEIITSGFRTGKAKLVFKSLETASSENPDTSAFQQQQVAAYAAGLQAKAWYYIELMYNEQGREGTNYVTEGYLEGLAKQVPGLNFKSGCRTAPGQPQERAQRRQHGSHGRGWQPSIDSDGRRIRPRREVQPIIGLPTSGYSAYLSALNAAA